MSSTTSRSKSHDQVVRCAHCLQPIEAAYELASCVRIRVRAYSSLMSVADRLPRSGSFFAIRRCVYQKWDERVQGDFSTALSDGIQLRMRACPRPAGHRLLQESPKKTVWNTSASFGPRSSA